MKKLLKKEIIAILKISLFAAIILTEVYYNMYSNYVLKNSFSATMDVGELKSSSNSFNMPCLVNLLKLGNSEFTSILDMSRQNLHSVYKNKLYHPRDLETYSKLDSITKIIVLLRLILKTPENDLDQKTLWNKIANWFRIPNPSYKMLSPFDMIAKGHGDEVIQSLTDILESTPA